MNAALVLMMVGTVAVAHDCEKPCIPGRCSYKDCTDPSCPGGVCDFTNCLRPSCEGVLTRKRNTFHRFETQVAHASFNDATTQPVKVEVAHLQIR